MANSDFRKIGVLGIVFLVIVRLSIGWQLLYEGLWKLETVGTAKEWTAEPYLKNAQGPLRQYFREMTGDPNDLSNMDYETVAARWSDWAERFSNHYELNGDQKKSLDYLLNGPEKFERGLAELPEGVKLPKRDDRGLYYDAEKKRLVVDGVLHMTPREKQAALKLVGFNEYSDDINTVEDPVTKKYIEQILKIFIQQSRLSIKEQAMAILQGDPEFAGVVDEKQAGTIDGKRLGKIEIYRNRLARYENKLARSKTQYDQDHLDYDWKEIQTLRSEIVGPIKGLEYNLHWSAENMLTTDQLAKGPLPALWTPQRDIDLKTMWGLTLIGAFLIAGLFTRLAALGGAVLLTNFYLAYPPFPGYPTPPGPEHAYIINKTLIEALMLLTFVFLPTGRWFGIDAMFSGLFGSKEPDDKA